MEIKPKLAIVAILMVITMLILSACNYGNRSRWSDEFKKNELNYTLVLEGDTPVLHEIRQWSDSGSESVMITTKCCDNYIWFSANNATLYKNKPTHLDPSTYIVCGN